MASRVWAYRMIAGAPQRIVDAMCAHLPSLMVRLPLAGIDGWAHTIALATGTVPDREHRRHAILSWMVNMMLSLRLGRMSTWDRNTIVRIDDRRFEALCQANRERGVVLALPHMGSWDLCGAWATGAGLPIASVAERLPAGEYAYFAAQRERMGMRIFPYDEPDLMARLQECIDQRIAVALLSDRAFSSRGIEVTWPTAVPTRPVRLPAGPFVLAERTGALIVPVTPWFLEGWPRTPRMMIELHDPIDVADLGLGAAAQRLAEIFADAVAAHPADWHMMRRYFEPAS